MDQNTTSPQFSVNTKTTSGYPKYKIIIAILLIFILFLLGFILFYANQYSSCKKQTSLATEPVISPSPAAKQNAMIKAGLYIPYINGDYSEAWTAYMNYDYNFSFLFPAKWKVDLSDDHMKIERLACYGCAGGFSGIAIDYDKNENKISLKDYISKLDLWYMTVENLESFNTKNPNVIALIERQTPGAGPGQTAYIINNTTKEIVELYCGGCTDMVVDDILSSFDFEFDRNHNGSWPNFL